MDKRSSAHATSFARRYRLCWPMVAKEVTGRGDGLASGWPYWGSSSSPAMHCRARACYLENAHVPTLRFRALLTDGAQEVRFEQVLS
jgi:hypothetical protein